MCGILGVLSNSGQSALELISDKIPLLRHRGPDEKGLWADPQNMVSFGHQRLAILDLSPTGRQPMASQCGRYVIVFNGEVYNYLELRRELQLEGKQFVGSSDTEVILTAFIVWGESCLQRFNGMFALAIYDKGNLDTPASLFLARDRAGKKPLYYAYQDRIFFFASELKAIPPSLRGGLDLGALNYYLALGYVPGSNCIVTGVTKLPPAHAARLSFETGLLKVWRWWSLPILSPVKGVSVEALTDEAEYLLRDAVNLRMRSDVPVGVLLSGGLDSSLVVACAAQVARGKIRTFTMGLPGSHLDESGYASIIARHFDTEHHLIEVPKPSMTVLEEFAHLVDEPIADSSVIPAYLVSKMTAQHVKVALGGDGGDELFGGYGDYTMAFADQRRFGTLPGFILRSLSELVGKLPPGVRGRNRLYALRGGPFQSLIWGSPFFDAATRVEILKPEAVEALGPNLLAPELYLLGLFNTGKDPIDSMTRTHFGSILPDDFLVKVDRASMAVSLEMRCPFLDVRLIEFAFGRLTSEWKVKGTVGRRLQKRLGHRLLPATLDINRKQGFSIPMNNWLRGADKNWCDGLDTQVPDSISPAAVRKLVSGLRRGRTNGARLFALIMLSIAARNLSSSNNV